MVQPREDMHRYDDILDVPHHVSQVHPPMPMEKRAAQFSPFAALTGYEDAVLETERMTDSRIELDENQRETLEKRLQLLLDAKERMPEVTLTWFVPDERKAGGQYVTHTGILRRFDSLARVLSLEDGTLIPADDVTEVSSEYLHALNGE